MKQPYIGNTKINKLYKGNELWCNWSSGGGEPIEPSLGYVTDNLMICCDAYGKTSADSFDGFYDSINGKKFNLSRGSASYETNCLNIKEGYLIYGNGASEYGSILKKSIKNISFEIVLKCGSYNSAWKTILTLGNYKNSTPFSIRTNINKYGGNKVMFVLTNNDSNKYAIRCLDKTKYWNHLIISIDGDGLGKIYANGQYSGSLNTISFDNNNNSYNSGLYIGYANANDSPLMSIGCIRYYHKALTEAEVLQNYNHEQSINRVTTLNFPALDDSYEDPVISLTFNTIVFCQKNNNINQNGTWSYDSYNCYTGTKSLYTNDKSSSITSNVLNLPVGSYKWSMYYHNSDTCILTFSVEGDYFGKVDVLPNGLTNSDFNTIMTFNITKPSNITLKMSAENTTNEKYCRFFDWKLEKIN